MIRTSLFRRPALLFGGWLALCSVLAGCGPHQQTAAPVNPDEARRTLQAVLENWQQGGSPDVWQQRTPKVVVQDWDWSSGAKLKEFAILGPGEARDANLFCQVKMVLEKPAQAAVQRTVTYVVGTDPVLTVFRDFAQ